MDRSTDSPINRFPDPSILSASVLVVDDNREVLTAIRLLLKDHVAEVQTATDPGVLPVLLREQRPDVILLDMNFQQGVATGQEGFHWLGKIREVDPDAVVILITAYGDVEKAVHAMKAGASDFIVKPWSNEKLVAAVRAGLARRKAAASQARKEEPKGLPAFGEMIGRSPAMQRVFETIRKVAQTDANVLILGEHGTGKELVAQAIHNHSKRAGGPFVSVDLGALSENLFESELFGYKKGAFTGAEQDRAGRFEAANGGTLFLDEIGNIPEALQRKLLTVLERRAVTRVGATDARPVDIRLVCATNAPIYEHSQQGEFRGDLLYRINTVEIRLPPLRERRADIPLLADHFLRLFARRHDRPAARIRPEAMRQLEQYDWPGNVRELRNAIERAVILSDRPDLSPNDFFLFSPHDPTDEAQALPGTLDLEDLERAAIRRALSKHGGNISAAAEELGLNRRSLYRRIEKYGL